MFCKQKSEDEEKSNAGKDKKPTKSKFYASLIGRKPSDSPSSPTSVKNWLSSGGLQHKRDDSLPLNDDAKVLASSQETKVKRTSSRSDEFIRKFTGAASKSASELLNRRSGQSKMHEPINKSPPPNHSKLSDSVDSRRETKVEHTVESSSKNNDKNFGAAFTKHGLPSTAITGHGILRESPSRNKVEKLQLPDEDKGSHLSHSATHGEKSIYNEKEGIHISSVSSRNQPSTSAISCSTTNANCIVSTRSGSQVHGFTDFFQQPNVFKPHEEETANDSKSVISKHRERARNTVQRRRSNSLPGTEVFPVSLATLPRRQRRGPVRFGPAVEHEQFQSDSSEEEMLPERKYSVQESRFKRGDHGGVGRRTVGGLKTTSTEEPANFTVKYVRIHGPEDGAYKNKSTPRGLIFMKNFEKFDNPEFSHRKGSEVDYANLLKLFREMGYKKSPKYCETGRITQDKFLNDLGAFSKLEEHKMYDSCIIILMSHGVRDKTFVCSDGVEVDLMQVYSMFSNANCDHLRNKPKIFILQFCRPRSIQKKRLSHPRLSQIVPLSGEELTELRMRALFTELAQQFKQEILTLLNQRFQQASLSTSEQNSVISLPSENPKINSSSFLPQASVNPELAQQQSTGLPNLDMYPRKSSIAHLNLPDLQTPNSAVSNNSLHFTYDGKFEEIFDIKLICRII